MSSYGSEMFDDTVESQYPPSPTGSSNGPHSFRGSPPPYPPSPLMCDYCFVRPRQSDPGDYSLLYCGPECAKSSGTPQDVMSMPFPDGRRQVRGCVFPECDKPLSVGDYCGQKHARMAVTGGQARGCRECQDLPCAPGSNFCSQICESRHKPQRKQSQMSTTAAPVGTGGDEQIRKRFLDRWVDASGGALPEVQKVQEIAPQDRITRRWDTYTSGFESRGGYSIKSSFYGGLTVCGLASNNPESKPCKSPACGVCPVIRRAFEDTPFNNGPHGKGIYTSLNPADAHKHAKTSGGREYRVTVLCSVAIPKSAVASREPDDVILDKGDERVFCPTKDSILPRWVIVYKVGAPRVNAMPNSPPRDVYEIAGPSRSRASDDAKDQKIKELEDKVAFLESELTAARERIVMILAQYADRVTSTPDQPHGRVGGGDRVPEKQADTPTRQKVISIVTPSRAPPAPAPAPAPPAPATAKKLGIFGNWGGGASSQSQEEARPLPALRTPAPSEVIKLDRRPTSRPVKARAPPMASPYDDTDVAPPLPLAPPSVKRRGKQPSQRVVATRRPERARYPDEDGFEEEDEFAGLPDLPPGARDVLPARRGGSLPGGMARLLEYEAEGPLMKSCALRGCDEPVHDDRAKYCGDDHRKEAVTSGAEPPCIRCKKLPKHLSQFCGKNCLGQAYAAAPLLILIDKTDPKWAEVVKQFNESWRHPVTADKPRPTVLFLYKVVQTQALTEAYLNYQRRIEEQGNFRSQKRSPGNERRRFHGTRRYCTIGDDPANLALCNQTGCALCSILRESFQIRLTGQAPDRKFQRFGAGIYSSSTSSKAHDYQQNMVLSVNKAVIMTTIVVGKGCQMTQDDTTLTAPPAGYDSVLGETGGTLNYDEVVVYTNDAIRPAWLVVYR